MKYKLKEHLIVLLFAVSIVLLIGCIVIASLLEWDVYAIVLVVIACAAVGFLTYAFVYDLLEFNKQKKEYEADGREEEESTVERTVEEASEEENIEDSSTPNDDEKIEESDD